MNRTTPSLLALTTLICLQADAATKPAAPVQKDPRLEPSTQPLSPEVMGLHTHADLVARDAYLTDSELAFELVNRGKIAVLTQIKLDIYVNNAYRQSIVVNPIPGDASRHTRVGLGASAVPGCGRTLNVGVVVDPQNQVAEFHDDNNRLDAAAAHRCPDLAVHSIKKNMNQYGTEYVAEVKLINKGDAVAPKFYYMATAQNAAIVTPLPNLDEKSKGPLAPGETTKFTIGNAFAHQDMHIWILLDRHGLVAELDESNNSVEKVLD